MSETLNFSNLMENNAELQPMLDFIESIMSLPDDQLNSAQVEVIKGMINGAFTTRIKNESIRAMQEGFTDQGFSREQAISTINTAKEELNSFIENLKPSEQKKDLLFAMFNSLYEIFDGAIEQYHNYNFELPILLDKDAVPPSYAHDTDVGADLYAIETITIKANTQSNMINTGVHIALPEGWAAYIVPRSSIGAKTPLRLSNSVGVIDSGYRGPLCVLYDNISDSDYTINSGDRIAQLIVMPRYRFKSVIVDKLDETARNDGGFGSSGK